MRTLESIKKYTNDDTPPISNIDHLYEIIHYPDNLIAQICTKDELSGD